MEGDRSVTLTGCLSGAPVEVVESSQEVAGAVAGRGGAAVSAEGSGLLTLRRTDTCITDNLWEGTREPWEGTRGPHMY